MFRQWTAYLDSSAQQLYIFHLPSYIIYTTFDSATFQTSGLTTSQLPSHSVPVSFVRHHHNVILLAFSSSHPPPNFLPPTTWPATIALLPPWERLLLQDTVFPRGLTSLHQYLTHNTPLLFCSDGCTPLFDGSFGAVCSASNGTRLATLSGPAPGYQTSSFCAESYGFLAILQQIFRLCEFLELPLPDNLQIFTESSSLIVTATKGLQWSYDYPYATMSADWDLQQAITSSLCQYSCTPTLAHVKGHQDCAVEVTHLPLPAQLNVEADTLAGLYKYVPSVSSSLALRIDGCSVVLHGPKGTIHSNYCQVLQHHAYNPPLQHYIQAKQNWTPAIFNLISWDTHSIAV